MSTEETTHTDEAHASEHAAPADAKPVVAVVPPDSAFGAAVSRGPNGELYGLLAEYDTPGELIAAARRVRDAGYTEFDCYSPFPVHGIDEAMGIKRTILPLLVLGGGFTGLFLGGLLQWWTNAYNWPWNISGKPTWSLPANIPIIFECTILIAVFTTFFGMWILNKLPQVWHPFFRLDRFARVSDDAFLLGIEAKDARFDLAATTKLLESEGAIAVEPCFHDADPAAKKMPKFIFGVILSTTVLALIPFAIIAKARASKSSEPHYHIFGDMDFQEKVKSDTAFDLFEDGRGNRGSINGTIARGSLNADDAYYRGLEKVTAADGTQHDAWITGLPKQLEVTQALVKRGQQRYNIYCTPCHGYDGVGQGAIPRRASDAAAGAMNPANLVLASGTATHMPNGQLFNTISNGYNTMKGYSSQIPHADRWAIVLYVRALERATNATLEDVPADRRGESR
jgi:mono/diheme cytochrome c family protein